MAPQPPNQGGGLEAYDASRLKIPVPRAAKNERKRSANRVCQECRNFVEVAPVTQTGEDGDE